jgi:rubrerythrin
MREESMETYHTPEHGWVCFHCGEHFSGDLAGHHAASLHFGATPRSDPACLLGTQKNEHSLLRRFRIVENELDALRTVVATEDTDKDREFHAMRAAHSQELIREEERGYERGMRDAKNETVQSFTCKYRNSGVGGNDPQECAWPECGCDPAMNKVIEHYYECGLTLVKEDEVEKLRSQVYVPGLWRCAKCSFHLSQANLNMHDGSVTSRNDPGDKCPNCNVPLWRVTEREAGNQMVDRCEELLRRVQELEMIITDLDGACNQAWKALAWIINYDSKDKIIANAMKTIERARQKGTTYCPPASTP